jgi:hypothetical protein
VKPSLFDAEFFIVIAVIWVLIVFSLCRGDAPPHDPLLPEPPHSHMRGSR